MILQRGIAWAVAGLYRAYFATVRTQLVLPDGSVIGPGDYPYGREIFACCERDLLVLGSVANGRRFATLIAPGRDGDRATSVFEAMSFRVIRGASRRGGAEALKALVQLLREIPEPLGLYVDGPLGPAGRAKRGAVVCALDTGRPLRPVGAAARHAFVFPGTWSGIYLPLPFTRVTIIVDHMAVPASADGDEVTTLTEELTSRLERARAAATRRARGARW